MDEFHWQQMLFQFIGGLSLFLFSIRYLADGMQQWAGERLREAFDKYTSNPLMGVITGTIVTILIQSSSVTIAITIGLISAGIMTLRQSIGVILGANIGTTMTAFLFGFDFEALAYLIFASGAFLLYFFKNVWCQHIGKFVFSVGGIFVALKWMTDSMRPLADSDYVVKWAIQMSDLPLFGVLIGTITTFVLQSSTATVGMLQGLVEEQIVPLRAALPILFGENIGTTITVIIASIGMGVMAKRAAFAHFFLNVFGTIIALLLLDPFLQYLQWLQYAYDVGPKMIIAVAHGTFNILNTAILLPFIPAFLLFLKFCVPGEASQIAYNPTVLNPHFIEQAPAIAMAQAKEEIIRMGRFAVQGIEKTADYIQTNERNDANAVYQIEEAIDRMDYKITNYLVKISEQPLSVQDSVKHHILIENVHNFERVGDHIENIVELLTDLQSSRNELTQSAKEDLLKMIMLTRETISNAVEAIDNSDFEMAQAVQKQEEEIDRMERVLRKKHIYRLNKGYCSAHAGIVFTDIISNLERIGDHAKNIADGLLQK